MIYLNESQAAKHIGVNMTTIRNWMYRKVNPLPYIKWGPRSIRITQTEVEEWLDKYRPNKGIVRLVDIGGAR